LVGILFSANSFANANEFQILKVKRMARKKQKAKRISAFDSKHQVTVVMEFVSLAQARYHNPHLSDFKYV
jgi:hypothetical protein